MGKDALHNITGIWAIDAIWLASHQPQMEALVRPWPDDFSAYDSANFGALDMESASRGIEDLYTIQGDGIATIPIHGPIVKKHSFWTRIFGFASSQDVGAAVRLAAASPDIRGILLDVDSPGGQVAGVHELAEIVRQANRIKPVFAHATDLMASAAYWVGSQSRLISMNSMGEVGSIGVMALVPDTTRLYQESGIDVYLIATGKFKGAGAPGVPVTEEHLEYFQSRVDETFQSFSSAVKRGRKMTAAEFGAVSDGRVFGATDAQNLKLIDRIRSLDGAIADASRLSSEQSRSVQGRIAAAVGVKQSLSDPVAAAYQPLGVEDAEGN